MEGSLTGEPSVVGLLCRTSDRTGFTGAGARALHRRDEAREGLRVLRGVGAAQRGLLGGPVAHVELEARARDRGPVGEAGGGVAGVSGAVANLTQPVLIGIIELAVAQGLAGSRPLAFPGNVALAAFENLDQVHAKLGLHHRADLVVLQRVHRPLEIRHRIARADPAEVAALGRRAVLRIEAGQFGEITAIDQAFADNFHLVARLGFGHHFVDADQDVARMRLLDRGRPATAALAEQLDDMETGRGTQQVADFTRLQARRRFGIERRQTVELAPAEAAALQGIRRIGEGRRQFGEVFTGLPARRQLCCALCADVRLRPRHGG